jgi:hypothetical protein
MRSCSASNSHGKPQVHQIPPKLTTLYDLINTASTALILTHITAIILHIQPNYPELQMHFPTSVSNSLSSPLFPVFVTCIYIQNFEDKWPYKGLRDIWKAKFKMQTQRQYKWCSPNTD